MPESEPRNVVPVSSISDEVKPPPSRSSRSRSLSRSIRSSVVAAPSSFRTTFSAIVSDPSERIRSDVADQASEASMPS